MEARFNLLDEHWIPVQGKGLVGIRDIFLNDSLEMLGGNPIQKIALFKLLCAIAQAACTPETEKDWTSLSKEKFKKECLNYLEKWKDRFFLYGPIPFLQMPSLKEKGTKVATFGALSLEKVSGNTTLLSDMQLQSPPSAAEKALLLVTLMGFAAGGKKVDNTTVLTSGYDGKSKSGKKGPSLGIKGYLHAFVLGSSILETLWMNLLSNETITKWKIYPQGVGTAPWEKMPEGEDCETARNLKGSLMGRLVPLCRFCLLAENGMHYTEGIAHDDHLSGRFDPTQSVSRAKNNKISALWADPDKKPWRSLTSILSFLGVNDTSRFTCLQVEVALNRARDWLDKVTLWSGGIRATSNAGEQYVTGRDDYVESLLDLYPKNLGDIFYTSLSSCMEDITQQEKILYGSVLNFYKKIGCEGKSQASKAASIFWEIAGTRDQDIVDACVPGGDYRALRAFFRKTVLAVYNNLCPHSSARQMLVWMECMPNKLNGGRNGNGKE